MSAAWHHLVAVGELGSTKFYIDGQLVGTAAFQSTSDIKAIGNYQGGGQPFGIIDEVVVYNSALTADDVASRYLVFLKDIYAKDTSRGGAGIQNGDQIIIRFTGATGATTSGSISTFGSLISTRTTSALIASVTLEASY